MALQATFSYVFSSPSVGSPPFETSMHATGPLDTYDRGDLDTLGAALVDAWNAIPGVACWSGLGGGSLEVVIDLADNVDEITYSGLTSTGDGQSTAPGIALRARLSAPRPPGGRQNAMYIPLPNDHVAGVDGAVDPGAHGDFATWGTNVLTAFAASDWVWVARHRVGGPTADYTYSNVTGVDLASTASYMRRRYR